MKKVIEENFKDLELNEFPYDRGHTALGEYHYYKPSGKYGSWYDPICLHQWRSMDGSWLVTSDENGRYLEQNRGDNTKGAFKDVYCCLVHKEELYSMYTLSFHLRLFELREYCGMAFNYLTSREYDFVGIKGDTISLYHRSQDSFVEYAKKEIKIDDLKTYHFVVEIGERVVVYLDETKVLEASISFQAGRKIACVAKSACRYSNIVVCMEDEAYCTHLEKKEKRTLYLKNKVALYPKLSLIKKISLQNFGSGRELRIRVVDGKAYFIIAQHQKRMMRDSFARISCLTCFDIEGNILWQRGEPNPSPDNTLISCDLPFQIADINGDGRFEVIYSMDFMIIIIDLLTGKEIVRIPTPVVENPYYRLNVDAIRVADFEGLGYKGNFIVKDRYQNVWAYNHKFEIMWQYHHKNTGHFPYIYDFDNDGKDEMFVGYDLVDHNGKIVFSLPMDSDHTDEIIWTRLYQGEEKKLVLASGNEGVNIVNLKGEIEKHISIGHAQRISVAKYCKKEEGLQIMTTSFWGSDGIVSLFNGKGELLKQIEQPSNGNVITPLNYDGRCCLAALNAGPDGGLVDEALDKVVLFPEDGHPTLCVEGFDIDEDGIDEILCFDQRELWIYKAESFFAGKKYVKYSDDGFSNYRGEFLIPFEYEN